MQHIKHIKLWGSCSVAAIAIVLVLVLSGGISVYAESAESISSSSVEMAAHNLLNKEELSELSCAMSAARKEGLKSVSMFGYEWAYVKIDPDNLRRRLSKEEYEAAKAGEITINWREVYWDDPDSPEEVFVFSLQAIGKAAQTEE